MTHNLFLAWSWFGHGQLTEMALAFAISQFVNLRKIFVLKRLKKFEAIQSAIEGDVFGRPGFPPTEKEVNKYLEDLDKRAPTGEEESLVRLFSELPGWVQEEDLHRGNIPKVGEWLEKDSQVRITCGAIGIRLHRKRTGSPRSTFGTISSGLGPACEKAFTTNPSGTTSSTIRALMISTGA